MSRAVELVRGFRRLRVLVIGDAMLDTYLEGVATRLCREGPVPVVRKTEEHRVPGGAANTAMNLRALGADVTFLGIVGDDIAGSALRRALWEQGVSDRWLIEDESFHTLHKLRVLADGHYIVRFDEDALPPSSVSRELMLAALKENVPRCDLIVISDYGYGAVSDEVIDLLRELRAARPCPLLVDSKHLHRFREIGATVVTPNHAEAELLAYGSEADQRSRILGPTGIDISAAMQVGERLLAVLDTEHVAITLAKEGVFLANRRGLARHIPTHPVAKPNDIGAGDSFAASMALTLAVGGNIEEAGYIALDAASIAVSKQRTAVVHHQELLQRVGLRDQATQTRAFTFSPRLSGDARQTLSQLLAQLDTERLRGRTIVFTNGVFDILHAGHVQFLRQAKTLGDVLIVGVNSDRSAERIKGKHRPFNNERDRAALVDALDMVDYVVLFDEDIPLELIRTLRPHLFVKGGDYADEALPEAQVVQEYGGRVVILPLAGSVSTSSVIERIIALATNDETGIEA